MSQVHVNHQGPAAPTRPPPPPSLSVHVREAPREQVPLRAGLSAKARREITTNNLDIAQHQRLTRDAGFVSTRDRAAMRRSVAERLVPNTDVTFSARQRRLGWEYSGQAALSSEHTYALRSHKHAERRNVHAALLDAGIALIERHPAFIEGITFSSRHDGKFRFTVWLAESTPAELCHAVRNACITCVIPFVRHEHRRREHAARFDNHLASELPTRDLQRQFIAEALQYLGSLAAKDAGALRAEAAWQGTLRQLQV